MINYISNGKVIINYLIIGLIKRMFFKKLLGTNVKVELDFPVYATEADF